MEILNILNAKGGGAILLGVLLLIVIVVSIFKKPNNDEEERLDNREISPLNLNDEDATVASLIAAIECRNQTHKNVRVISVREVK